MDFSKYLKKHGIEGAEEIVWFLNNPETFADMSDGQRNRLESKFDEVFEVLRDENVLQGLWPTTSTESTEAALSVL